MAVNLSPVGGVAGQFFDNNGNPLSGGKLYTYAAGTTTPLATYTTSVGNVPHTNPIIFDSAGRVPGGQIWLTDGSVDYKFLLETSFSVLVGTFDNIPPAISGSAADIVYLPAGTGAVATTVQTKLRESVSVKDFGAVGDGVTDDTAAITLAFATTATSIYFPPGTYRISQPAADGSHLFTSSLANRTIAGPGVITAASQVRRLLLVTGDNSVISLNVDGNNSIGVAITVSANNPIVTGCNICNLNGFNNWQGVGIRLAFNGIDSGALISNNVIRNLQGVGDGVVGNGVGMQRAITIDSNQNLTKRILVTGNHISQIEGEEGDSIVVISSDGASNYFTMPVVIEGNVIDLWTRRAIKVQAQGVSVLNNTFSNDRPSALPSFQNVIDFVQGGNHTASGNVFNKCKFQSQIAAVYALSEASNNFVISDNTILGIGSETSSTLITINAFGNGVVVAANRILCPGYTGTSIAVRNTSGGIISANTIQADTAAWFSFTSSSNIRLNNNVIGNLQVSSYHNYYDLTHNEFVHDVTSGRSITLYQRDPTLSVGEILAKINCRQNDPSFPDAIHASIAFVAEGSAGALGIGFYAGDGVTPDVERVRILSSGIIRPAADNTQSLGTGSFRWSTLFAGTGTINTSDAREKQQVSILTGQEKAVAVKLKSLIRSFKFIDSVEQKGDSARIHFGVMAQDVKAAFESEGLVAEKYGMLCYDEWAETPENKDAEGNITQAFASAGNRYGVRYDEMLAFIVCSL